MISVPTIVCKSEIWASSLIPDAFKPTASSMCEATPDAELVIDAILKMIMVI